MSIIGHFSNAIHKPDLRLTDWKKIFDDVRICYKGVKKGRYENCTNYCDYYKINSLSPLMEGYTTHINLLKEHME